VTGAFGRSEEDGKQEIKSLVALHLTGAPTVLAIMESMRSMYKEGVMSDEDVWDAAKK